MSELNPTTARELFIQGAYLASSVLFIVGLRSLTRPEDARTGMRQAAFGMLLAICGTMVNHEIISYGWILGGLAIGTAIGVPLGLFVPMTAMPQRIAISHLFGAVAATLVGMAEFYDHVVAHPAALGSGKMAALGFEVLFGGLTITGSFMAFGKLQGFISGRPITFKGQNFMNISMFVVALGLFAALVFKPAQPELFIGMVVIALVLGVLFVLPIGGADMPVVVSILNSYAGLASAATGFALDNNVLIICGALDGASGFLLSILMSKAMNRSFANVLFGAFGQAGASTSTKSAEGLEVHALTLEDAALQLAYARSVIVIPGYGMAVAQSQHAVRELAELIEKKGGEVKYAIHPVAGRMPGHMNVLLAEANVPYEKLYDLDEINEQFAMADVALVIGANDVVNPAAKNDPGSPLFGMPILNVHHAKRVIVMKRGMAPGFSGIENELFYDAKTSMLFGDAKASLAKLVTEVKNA
jgi:NAD(P) transhydrogenase subunit beta